MGIETKCVTASDLQPGEIIVTHTSDDNALVDQVTNEDGVVTVIYHDGQRDSFPAHAKVTIAA